MSNQNLAVTLRAARFVDHRWVAEAGYVEARFV